MSYCLENQESIAYNRVSPDEFDNLIHPRELDEDGKLVSLIEQIDEE